MAINFLMKHRIRHFLRVHHRVFSDSKYIEREIEDANRRYAGKVAIRHTNLKGWSLFALTNYAPGAFIMRGIALSVASRPDSHSVQIEWHRHATMDLPARFINHRCNDANVGIRANNVGAYDFYAIRHIQVNEELLWDYETSEYDVSTPFACQCGSLQCRGIIKGFKYNADQVIRAYGEEFIAPYLLKQVHKQDD